jgi:hypothetical protein
MAKSTTTNRNNKRKHRRRSEVQERPNKPYADAIRDKIHDSSADHDLEGEGRAD